MSELPTHLGGLQHLEPDVIAREGDVLVESGAPQDVVTPSLYGVSVGAIEDALGMNVYRRIPVAKQGDLDHPVVAQEVVPDPAYQRLAQSLLPTDAAKRKATPIYSGCIAYFPDAIAAVAQLSQIGNEQHNPGKPLHWDRSKSGDEADALMRHLLQKDEVDKDGVPHIVKVAWRGLAAAQKYLEARK